MKFISSLTGEESERVKSGSFSSDWAEFTVKEGIGECILLSRMNKAMELFTLQGQNKWISGFTQWRKREERTILHTVFEREGVRGERIIAERRISYPRMNKIRVGSFLFGFYLVQDRVKEGDWSSDWVAGKGCRFSLSHQASQVGVGVGVVTFFRGSGNGIVKPRGDWAQQWDISSGA